MKKTWSNIDVEDDDVSVGQTSAPPPYSSESAPSYRPNDTYQRSRSSRTQWMQSVSQTRTTHLRNVVYSSILPIVRHRATRGLSRSIIALVPSRATAIPTAAPLWSFDSDTTSTNDVEVIGLVSSLNNDDSDDENELVQIQLETETDTVKFWSQKAVLDELKKLVQESLEHNEDEDIAHEKVSEKKDFEEFGASKRGRSVAGKAAEQNNTYNTVVKVTLDEICLRTQNSFGLYETFTRDGAIVEVALGADIYV